MKNVGFLWLEKWGGARCCENGIRSGITSSRDSSNWFAIVAPMRRGSVPRQDPRPLSPAIGLPSLLDLGL